MRVSDFVVRRWYVGIVVFAVILSCFLYCVDKIPIETNYISYFPKKDLYLQDALYFSSKMGSTDPHYISLSAPQGQKNYFTNVEVLKKVYAYEQALRKDDPDIVHILSFSQYAAFFNNVYNGQKETPSRTGLILTLSKYLEVLQNQLGGNTISMSRLRSFLWRTLPARRPGSSRLSVVPIPNSWRIRFPNRISGSARKNWTISHQR